VQLPAGRYHLLIDQQPSIEGRSKRHRGRSCPGRPFCNIHYVAFGARHQCCFGRQAGTDREREAVARWRSILSFHPYHESRLGVFPRIKMTRDCHVAAMHYYYAAVIFLDRKRAPPAELEQHAREICGLVFQPTVNPSWSTPMVQFAPVSIPWVLVKRADPFKARNG